jgi:uncharacterized protein with HEPN domain
MRSDADRVSDILEAIDKVKARTPDTENDFQRDELVQVWVIHYLQRIGEAARALSPALKKRYPEVPWAEIIALRNLLVHEYFGLNMQQVWTMTQRDLTALEEQIRQIHSELSA